MHAHIFPKEALSKIEKKHGANVPRLVTNAKGKYFILINGRSSGPMDPMEHFYNAEKRIKIMNDQKIDFQVLSITPTNFCYDSPPEVGVQISYAQNNGIADVVNAHPDKFIGSATVPLQDVYESVEELDRTVKDLGFTSVEIGSNIAGKNLDSLELYPFYEKAEKLRIPIIVHPINNTGADRMQRYYLSNIVGNPLETTIAQGCIIFGGILDKFKELKFCWVHGGGFLPYQIGRFDHGYDVRQEPKVNISKRPSEYLKTMYYDTITHSKSALSYLINIMGVSNILLGTDFPFDMGQYNIVSQIQEAEVKDKERVLGENSAKLFKIE